MAAVVNRGVARPAKAPQTSRTSAATPRISSGEASRTEASRVIAASPSRRGAVGAHQVVGRGARHLEDQVRLQSQPQSGDDQRNENQGLSPFQIGDGAQ